MLRRLSFDLGKAEGELRGRLELSKELEIAYGVDAGHDMTAEDVKNIGWRQIH